MKNIGFTPDGVIFDVDGTIWDSTNVVKDAWIEALAEIGYKDVEVTADRLKGLFGLQMGDIVKALVPTITEEEIERFIPIINACEQDQLNKRSGIPFEGIEETIQKLSEKIPVFIVSNCQSGYIELVSDYLKIGPFIKDYACFGDTGLSKADNIKMINEKHSLKRSVYVGDTVMDEEACRGADEFFIFASYGFGEAKEPDAVIEKAEELLQMV